MVPHREAMDVEARTALVQVEEGVAMDEEEFLWARWEQVLVQETGGEGKSRRPPTMGMATAMTMGMIMAIHRRIDLACMMVQALQATEEVHQLQVMADDLRQVHHQHQEVTADSLHQGHPQHQGVTVDNLHQGHPQHQEATVEEPLPGLLQRLVGTTEHLHLARHQLLVATDIREEKSHQCPLRLYP